MIRYLPRQPSCPQLPNIRLPACYRDSPPLDLEPVPVDKVDDVVTVVRKILTSAK